MNFATQISRLLIPILIDCFQSELKTMYFWCEKLRTVVTTSDDICLLLCRIVIIRDLQLICKFTWMHFSNIFYDHYQIDSLIKSLKFLTNKVESRLSMQRLTSLWPRMKITLVYDDIRKLFSIQFFFNSLHVTFFNLKIIHQF